MLKPSTEIRTAEFMQYSLGGSLNAGAQEVEADICCDTHMPSSYVPATCPFCGTWDALHGLSWMESLPSLTKHEPSMSLVGLQRPHHVPVVWAPEGPIWSSASNCRALHGGVPFSTRSASSSGQQAVTGGRADVALQRHEA